MRFYNGSSWQTVKIFVKGTDFNNDTFYKATVLIDSEDYIFSSNMKIRFVSKASSDNDEVYIDEVRVTAR